MRILLTNDDGIGAEGLRTLERALEGLPGSEIYTSAPLDERSAASHSISLRRGIRYVKFEAQRWGVEGTPVDAVIVALSHVLGFRPDLVVSGINHGGNLGKNVHYSGTVSAAAEAVLNGIPAMAVSLCGRPPYDFAPTAKLAAGLAAQVLAQGMPEGCLLNVNVPNPWSNGVRATRAYRHLARTSLVELEGREGLWFREELNPAQAPPDSDYTAILEGSASVSLLEVFRAGKGENVEIKDFLNLNSL